MGRRRKIVAGKLAGKHGIKAILEESGLHPSERELTEIVKRIKEIGDKGKVVTDIDLLAIAGAVMGAIEEEKRVIDLLDLAVVTGIKAIPMASVKLRLRGK